MALRNQEHVLLIGDTQRQMYGALAQALPGAGITSVSNYFDGIAELSANGYTAVLAAAEPIERRPEAAVRTLRQLAGEGRLLLFGHPTLEPLARKMLDFGCDDYLVSPAGVTELQQMFGSPPLRLSHSPGEADDDMGVTRPAPPLTARLGMPLADILLDALLLHPQAAPDAALATINAQLGPAMRLARLAAGEAAPAAADGMMLLTHAVRMNNQDAGLLCLMMPRDEEEPAGRHFLSQLAHLFGKLTTLQDRHNRLQRLAITDDLTGLYNGRYFRHFLTKIIERARTRMFPVTLLLFDIDNFKSYNAQYGHGVGDEILKQTASLMRRCVRDHDLVARISGDEFAVVFWEKDGPRQPREAGTGPAATAPGMTGRPPQTPQLIIDRFRKLLATQTFGGLGAAGQGRLTISGGLAVFPYHAADVQSLIHAADHALMFQAKQSGKNSFSLVGEDDLNLPPEL
jgi:GGDEF domain-containing protein